MIEKVVLDTNYLIYSIDIDSKYYQTARTIIESNNFECYITSKNISEFCAVLTKSNKVDFEKINIELSKIIKTFTIIYYNEKTTDVFCKLLEKYHPKGNRVYDIEIVSIMLSNGFNKLATINTDDFININEIELI